MRSLSNGRDVDAGPAPGVEVKSVWKGVISFGLVSIPIRLYAATEERGVALHQVHVKDGGRIRYRRFCTADGEEVPFEDIVRGYELPTGEVVVLTDEDFAELPLSSSRAIDVLSFVDADSLDPVQFSRSYYCEPADPDAKPYILLRNALDHAGKVAMVKVALRQRDKVVAPADMLPANEDLRHGITSVRPFDHLGAQLRLAGDVDLGEFDALTLEQLLGGNAVGAVGRGVDLDGRHIW